ncbi:hypothetical protein GUJ93_ZPchr0009g336 [Zizania palustris]|uniref:Uncharacterized protein n=1 Tax=Zizania palustris TaxID=103762 RepID=A0A8J5S1C3_ZIZPA|nr:hypothetical protein GUJ93_ZPchr0009g336 [Zizania palustris]
MTTMPPMLPVRVISNTLTIQPGHVREPLFPCVPPESLCLSSPADSAAALLLCVLQRPAVQHVLSSPAILLLLFCYTCSSGQLSRTCSSSSGEYDSVQIEIAVGSADCRFCNSV